MSLPSKWASMEDLQAAECFVEDVFGKDSIQSASGRLAWIGFGHPSGVHTWLVSRRENLVALCCHIPVLVSLGSDEIEAAFAVDLMVEPGSRRQGIGRKSLEQRCQRYGLSLSTGQSKAMAGLYAGRENHRRLAGWHRALFVRRLRPSHSWKGTAREVVASLVRRLHSSVAGTREVLNLDEAVGLLGELPQRFAVDEVGIKVSATHFRWRYGGPVYQDYSFFRLKTEAGVQGLLVARQAGDTEYAVDLFCSPCSRRDCFRLAGQTTPGGRLIAENAGNRLASAQREAGFLVRSWGSEVVAVSGDAALLDRLGAAAWCGFSGESDVDLIREPSAVVDRTGLFP